VAELKRKEFTSFDVAAVVRELRDAIIDSRVNNVYQLDDKTLILKLHRANSPALMLILEAGRRLHLTSYDYEKPLRPPAFCMALRKHLRNAWLTDIVQHEFERVVTLSFRTTGGVLRLILELFGDGNVILVSEDGKISQALIYKRMRDRNILRNEAFEFAPSIGKNPLRTDRPELFKGLQDLGDVEVVRGITRLLSIGGAYAEEVLLRASIDKNSHCNGLSEHDVSSILDGLQNLILHVMNAPLQPCIVLDESGDYLDVMPFRLKRYEAVGFDLKSYGSFGEALDEFYLRVVATEKSLAGIEAGQLERETERLRRILADQQKALSITEINVIQDRRIGDAIYAHSSDLQVLLDRFSKREQGAKGWKAIVAETLTEKEACAGPGVLFESFDERNMIVNVHVECLCFGLDVRRSLFENASRFYEQSKHAKQKLVGVKASLEETRKKLAEVEAKINHVQAFEKINPAEADFATKIKHREWFEKFHWFISSDGFLVVAGKDSVTNEVLIKKHTQPDDIVFHADIVGAPFTVVKTCGKQPDEQSLQEAGEFAAVFSRGWREGFGNVDVYWVKPEQLSKSGPSGEYVTHGAFAVNGKRNWMRNIALRIAVGLVVNDESDEIEFIGGPLGAVKAKTTIYVIITPGDLTGKEIFEQILKTLSGKTTREQRDKVRKSSVEEIREFVPYGRGSVSKD
jgi:predicted ribosome quality control (RQC) complex YloA/Tae2 family protein